MNSRSFTNASEAFLRNSAVAILASVFLFPVCGAGSSLVDGVANGSFEMESTHTNRPAYWYEGFPDSPASYGLKGDWALDDSQSADGNRSLRVEPNSNDGYLFSQVLHVPTYDLSGKQINISVDMRYNGLSAPASVFVFAYNPEIPPDPVFGIGLAGSAYISIDGAPDTWETYTGSFTATNNALALGVILQAAGTNGMVWFDNVRVELSITAPEPDAPVSTLIVTNRSFLMGIVGDLAQDLSERAREELMETAKSAAEIANLFFHVRWIHLTGESLADGYREGLEKAELAERAGLRRILTFDFTHGGVATLGELIPAPGGNPPPGADPFDLSNPVVRNAYRDELLDLFDVVQPEWVLVGIEVDIFHDRHPDQWGDYVTLFKACHSAIKLRDPTVRVGAYFTLPWMVSTNAVVNTTNAAAWQMLLPELDFIGYSVYPGYDGSDPDSFADGYFSAAGDVAPGRPLFLPEFGIVGGPADSISESEQAALFERIVTELSCTNVEAACWYQLHDNDYIGFPSWFSAAFSRVGLLRRDGSIKPVWSA